MKLLLKDTPVMIRFFGKYPRTYFIDTETEFDFLIPNKNVYGSKYKGKMYCKIDISTQKILPIHATKDAKRENTIMIYANTGCWVDVG